MEQKKILIVEDDLTLQPFWTSAFRKADPEAVVEWVCEERDAERALREAQKNNQPYDLIVTDLFLQGTRTGIDLFEVSEPEAKTRMLLTSGIHPDKFQRYFGSDPEKAPPFLQKPYSLAECVETLKWMLGTEGEFGLPHLDDTDKKVG